MPKFHPKYIKFLDQNEDIVKIIRRSKFILYLNVALSIFFLSIVFFFLPLLIRYRAFGLGIFLTLMFVIICYFARRIFLWGRNYWVITTKKIVDVNQNGLFNKSVSHIPLYKINNISMKMNGLFQTIMRTGVLEISLMSDTDRYQLCGVSHLLDQQQLIYKILENYHQGENTKNNPY